MRLPFDVADEALARKVEPERRATPPPVNVPVAWTIQSVPEVPMSLSTRTYPVAPLVSWVIFSPATKDEVWPL